MEQGEADHDLVAVIAQPHPVGPFVLREVPGIAGQAVVRGQDLLDVGVADALGPFQEPAVAGHGREADQGLEHVAVQLGPGIGQKAEAARDRCVAA